MPSRTAPSKPATPASVLASLQTALSKAFDQAQSSTANHHKNFVALHKLHADAATVTEPVNNGEGIKLIGERAFEDVFVDMVSRVLSVKKGAAQADRIVRFVGGFVKFVNEKGGFPGHSASLSNPLLQPQNTAKPIHKTTTTKTKTPPHHASQPASSASSSRVS
jgi:hypothetical protein